MRRWLSLEQEKVELGSRAAHRNHDLKPDNSDTTNLQPGESHAILRMQQTRGNAYVRRYLAQMRSQRTAQEMIRRAPDKPPANEPASGIYMIAKIDGGDIKGSSQRPGRKGQIELSSFSQLVENNNTSGGAAGSNKPRVTGAKITKMVDDTTLIFGRAAIEGKLLDFHFEFVKADEDKESVSLTVDFNEATINHAVDGTTETLKIYAKPK